MKTGILFLLVCLLSGSYSFAQTEENKEKLKFVEFQMTDLENYVFQNEKDEYVEFNRCRAVNNFSRELDEDEANEDNQGWGSNEQLQGKWFLISWTEEETILYENGPIEKIKTITKIEALK